MAFANSIFCVGSGASSAAGEASSGKSPEDYDGVPVFCDIASRIPRKVRDIVSISVNWEGLGRVLSSQATSSAKRAKASEIIHQAACRFVIHGAEVQEPKYVTRSTSCIRQLERPTYSYDDNVLPLIEEAIEAIIGGDRDAWDF